MRYSNIAKIKALLLSKETIELSSDMGEQNLYSSIGNIGKNEWIFIRISETSRVRLTLSKNAKLILGKKVNDNYYIQDSETAEVIVEHVVIEQILAHAPEQLFFLLNKECSNGCLFCPLTYKENSTQYNKEYLKKRLKDNQFQKVNSVSFSTSCPPKKTTHDLVNEIIDATIETKKIFGNYIPLGASVKTPTREDLIRLKQVGISEVRLNLEIYNSALAKTLMPNKNIQEILYSIEEAVKIFGKEKVSSNIIIGIGESDSDILEGVKVLAEIGALSTLYPYDSIGISENFFKRPSAERIYYLAKEQKEIFRKYSLNPLAANTMCCSCTASHLYPGRDL